MKKTITLLKTVSGLCLLLGFSASAQITVTNTNDSGAGSLRQAVIDVNAGGTIMFDSDIDGNTITLNSEIAIDKNITIQGNGDENTIISGNDETQIFVITDADVTIEDLTLTEGSSDMNGGAIWASGSVVMLSSVTVSDSEASGAVAGEGGGGIWFTDGETTIEGSLFTNNTADGAAGSGGSILVGAGGTLTVENSTISDSFANRAGGGIESSAGTMVTLDEVTLEGNSTGTNPGNGGGFHITGNGNATIMASMITNNEAGAEGGGLWNGSGMMTINGETEISGNWAHGDGADQGGGGIYNLSGMVNISGDVEITGNQADGDAGSGGGILNDVNGKLTIEDTEISGNISNRAGGGIEDNSGSEGFVMLTDVMLNANVTNTSPGNGGGLHVTGAGMVTITGGTVNDNEAGAEGGGLWNGSGMMTISGDTEISGNRAHGDGADQGGGGIYNLSGTVEISGNVMITENHADGTAGSGGGILNDVGGTLEVEDAMITMNTSSRAGGGIEDNGGTAGSVMLMNVTLDGNSAGTSPGNGGGFHMTGMGNASITGGVVSNNDAVQGGGLWNGTGMMTVTDVEISGNTASGAASTDGGGGIYNNGGTLEVSGSTLAENETTGLFGQGGGLHVNGGMTTMMKTTVSGNTSLISGGGVFNNGELMLNANTVANNSALISGGGIFNNGESSLTLKNTLAAGNVSVSGADIATSGAEIESEGFNLIAMADSGVFLDNEDDMVGVDMTIEVELMMLADNGGSTRTHRLACPSPAADAGDPEDNSNDQLNQGVFNGRRDIGAYEEQQECATAGVKEFDLASNSMVYPNPSLDGLFNLDLALNHSTGATISIYEIGTGKLVKSMTADSMNVQIGVDNMSTGTYVMQIVSDNATETHKLVVGK